MSCTKRAFTQVTCGMTTVGKYVDAGYMQMTQEQVEEWSQNPDQYVADEEEETFSVRVSGELVLDELMEAFPEAAVAAVAAAVHRRLQEAAQAKVSCARSRASSYKCW